MAAASHSIEYAPGLELDLHIVPNSAGRPLIVFVHGGAWIADDKSNHVELTTAIAAATGCAVAVPQYRHSPDPRKSLPEVHHPRHAQDVLQALEFLYAQPASVPVLSGAYKPSQIVLIGHSCGAHILASIVMASPEPELSPSAGLLSALNGVICSEGIFDIDLLLRSFPTYGPWFIQVAFGSREDYESVSTARLKERKAIPWLLVHSRGDTLVDLAQAQVMQESLITLRGGDSTKVETEWEFEDEHDDVLKNPQFVQAVASFVKRYTI